MISRLFKGPTSFATKTFWLAVIGQLIICQSIEQCRKMLESIFIVAKSPTDGRKKNKDSTPCEIHREKLESLIGGMFFVPMLIKLVRSASYIIT